MSEQAQREAELKRRKVRKGTHSCWECRRRKIRCQYAGNDTVCLPCQARGSTCRSQEYVDKDTRPSQQPDRRMAQRLGRLEDLMARLVDRIIPEAGGQLANGSASRSNRASPTPSQDSAQNEGLSFHQTLDVLEASLGPDTPAGLLLGLRDAARPSSMLTPESDQSPAPAKLSSSRYSKSSRTLYALFPPQDALPVLLKANAGPYYLTSLFSSFRDLIEGKVETANCVAVIPLVASHPTVLARRLLQICICMQQLHPGYDTAPLQIKGTIPEYMNSVVTTVTNLVTSIDEIVSTGEGLECLVLLGLWHANAGNLRKAWLTYRRALSLGQLMGIDRGSTRALKFVDTSTDPLKHSTPAGLWYRINACDRVSSLLLGLPAGDLDNSFATEEAMKRDTAMERLEKLHVVLTGRIIERNATRSSSEAYAITQSIDAELQSAATSMGADWWSEPDFDMTDETGHKLGEMLRQMLQMRHFDLLILLHLPYMLRDPSETRYDYSKTTCARSSREVLKRFIPFRSKVTAAWACRHVDYSALVASMTLLLTYLRQHQHATEPAPTCKERNEDRKLVEVVRERMQHVAITNRDKVTQESADILGQMMPILDLIDRSLMGDLSECNSHVLKCLHLKVPYLGTINFHPNVNVPEGQGGNTPFSRRDNAGTTPCPVAFAGTAASTPGMEQLQPQMAGLSTTHRAVTPSVPAMTQGGDDMQVDMAAFDPALLPPDTSINGMYMDFDVQPQDGALEIPDLMAGAEDWVLQGLDTTYWSLINGNNMAWGT
ncbi:transcription factor sdnS [Rhypophila decipiens]|uniref:Transcription factor sdnS n=1 Tax=Rhypophila decipiens TaxID=261697 RepID=A0AAN7B124_9PEZI|nr:transcription factor sdnS [Rhypophila decipiens]